MKYLIAIAENGSLAAAASQIGIAQPSLSQHIKGLEERLGIELIVRSPRGVELTEAGHVMLLHARRLTAAMDLALEEVRMAGTDPVGQVIFGFPSSVSMVLSVPLAETLRLEHPKIRFRAVEAMSGFIREWLADGSIDLAILYDIAQLKNTENQLLMAEDLHFYCAADGWPFTDIKPGEPVPLEQIAAKDLVLPSSSHGLRSLIDRFCRTQGILLNVIIEMDSLSQILSLVARGSAVTILAPAAAQGYMDDGKLLSSPIVEPTIRRPVYIARNAGRMVTRASREVERITLQVMRELVERNIWKGHLVT